MFLVYVDKTAKYLAPSDVGTFTEQESPSGKDILVELFDGNDDVETPNVPVIWNVWGLITE